LPIPLNSRGSVETAFERLVLGAESLSEIRQGAVERFEPAGIVGSKRRFSLDHVDRRPLFGAGLGEHESVRAGPSPSPKWNATRSCLPAGRFPRRPAMESTGDHQMKHKKQIAFELPDDPFAKAAERKNAAAFSREEIGHDCPHDKRAAKVNPLDRAGRA